MTPAAPPDEQPGPTIILVGGPMTVDDGTTLDSRQPIDGDPESETIRRCLAGSMLWWLTAISLVNPILDDAAGDAFALVIGARTLLELQADDSIRRNRLRSVVRERLGTVELRGATTEKLGSEYEHVGAGSDWRHWVWLRQTQPRRRWRALKHDSNEWYLAQATPELQPTVIVDTTDTVLHGVSCEPLRERRLYTTRSSW